MEALITIGWVVFALWSILNLICLFVFADQPGELKLDRDMRLGDILAFVFIIPIPVLFWNFVTTDPVTCFKNAVCSILEWQPFKKKD